MLWCGECMAWILRSDRYEHPHDLSERRDVTDEKEELTEDCNVRTQPYEVEFVYEYRETVRVEAAGKSEAKWKAQDAATLTGEYIDTLHTSTRTVGDKSVATIDYLETHGLLPEDHDVTPEDIERLAAKERENDGE